LAQLLPGLLETAYSGTWNLAQGVGQMPAPVPDHCQTHVFRCGGGLSITEITQTIMNHNNRMPLWHNSQHDYFVFDEMDKLTQGAQQSLRPSMDLKRCMYLMTTNYLNKIDKGIVNRCHLVEMNQITTPSVYLPLGQSILRKMGVGADAVSDAALLAMAAQAQGSLRDFSNDVAIQGIRAGGVVT
jgi:DNA polymerase III delta prime subunit